MIRHRFLVPALAGFVTFVLFMAMLIQESNFDPGLLFSARAAVSDMFSAYIVLLPVLCGIAASDALLLRRRGTSSVFTALPPAAQGRYAMIRAFEIWTGSVSATLLACVVACIAAVVHGSRITVMAFMLVPVMLVGMVAFISIGYTLGFWVRSWVVPPLIVILGYVRPQVDILGFIDMYNNASAPWAVVQHPVGVLYLSVVGLLLLMMLTALAWLNASRVMVRKIVAGILTLACLVCFFLTMPVMASDSPAWVDDAHSDWPCQTLDSGMQVCAPPEIPGDMALAVAQLTPLVPRLLSLDSGLADARFVPGDPGIGELAYALPMGQDASAWDQAQAVVDGIGAACATKWSDGPDETIMAISQDSLLVSVWVADNAVEPSLGDLGLQQPVTLAEARVAYDRLIACDY